MISNDINNFDFKISRLANWLVNLTTIPALNFRGDHEQDFFLVLCRFADRHYIRRVRSTSLEPIFKV